MKEFSFCEFVSCKSATARNTKLLNMHDFLFQFLILISFYQKLIFKFF